MRAPFPYFGGKSTVAHLIWERFGSDIYNLVDPFFGSGAVLLARPYLPDYAIETVNDRDGYISNVFRAIRDDPATMVRYADRMVIENDLHAIHAWLISQKADLVQRLEGDPDYYDVKIAGWWLWGISCWIGGGFTDGEGPWKISIDETGIPRLVNEGNSGAGISRRRISLGAGRGVSRRLVSLKNSGMGVNRQMVHLGGQKSEHALCHSCGEGLCGLYAWMEALSARLRRVRVCCGDWSRICGPSPTWKLGQTAVFLDPPYSAEASRDLIYACDSIDIAQDVRTWCRQNGENPLLRIALCGYSGEGHEVLEAEGWDVMAWKAQGGYGWQGKGRGRDNRERERIWFSPACLKPARAQQMRLLKGG